MKLLYQVMSATILVILLPIMILIAIAIRIETVGNPLFFQTRVGRKKKYFLCVKFRTMSEGTPNLGSHLVNPSSITKVGAVLRSTKIDELPQLWNILKGEMLPIGYRPCLPNQKDVIYEREKLGVFEELPGITGLAQINKVDMSNPKKLALYDKKYSIERTLFSDIKILVSTISGSGSGDAAKK